ncbi:unnamed protein product [Amoebophrya sp. A25]|nr:unnamed protein product [Amoebophrya sp. A25]|eukprot:GSA25T00004896001.1
MLVKVLPDSVCLHAPDETSSNSGMRRCWRREVALELRRKACPQRDQRKLTTSNVAQGRSKKEMTHGLRNGLLRKDGQPPYQLKLQNLCLPRQQNLCRGKRGQYHISRK